uniref:(northern house mosquito) hypothetical protein n=1 Tax=Culex pipiens TaxID=7175 RepID=A0A8D8DG15_CULPI
MRVSNSMVLIWRSRVWSTDRDWSSGTTVAEPDEEEADEPVMSLSLRLYPSRMSTWGGLLLCCCSLRRFRTITRVGWGELSGGSSPKVTTSSLFGLSRMLRRFGSPRSNSFEAMVT